MRLNFRLLNLGGIAVMLLLIAAACTKEDTFSSETISPLDDEALEERGLVFGKAEYKLVGLTPFNELVHLLSGPPVVEKGVVPIIGTRPQEIIIAIDYRNGTKEHYGISNQSIVYKIDVNSGVAQPLSVKPIEPAIEGETVGFDFDPVEDVIRLVTSSGQNLRISPDNGTVLSVDENLQPGTPAIQGSAYSVPTEKSPKNVLYTIDYAEQALFASVPAEEGVLEKIGPLGFVFEGEGGFEITHKNDGFAIQNGKSLFPGSAAGSSTHDDITQQAYRLLKINLKYGNAKSYGQVRPMIGLTSR